MNPSGRGTVAVTGASGYVGSVVRSYLDEHGYSTIALTRRPMPPGVPDRRFVLGGPVEPDMFAGVDCLIHAAWDMTLTNVADAYRVNVVGSQALLRAARRAGVQRIIFVSSMSAYEGTRQFYGRAKLEVESLVSKLGGISLRLGLVYGPEARGMAGALAKLSRLPVVPIPGGQKSYQFLLHSDDLGPVMVRALRSDIVGVVGVARPSKVLVPEVIRQVGGRSDAKFVGVPWRPLYVAMRIAERSGIELPIRGDSLLGLVRPASQVPNFDALGISYR